MHLDNLVMMSERIEGNGDRFKKSKEVLYNNSLKINLGKNSGGQCSQSVVVSAAN